MKFSFFLVAILVVPIRVWPALPLFAQNTMVSALRIPSQSEAPKSLDEQMARRYLKEAYVLWQKRRAVWPLLETAKEYRGDSLSDYWYLMAMSETRKWRRLEWLKRAFQADRWLEVSPLPAAIRLVQALYDWQMYSDVIAWAGRLRPEITDHRDIQFYLAMSLHNIGQGEQAKELALRNLGRYDDEARYFRILLDMPDETMWSRFHFYLESYPPDSPNLLRYLAGKSHNHKERLISIYSRLFGDDYFTTAQRILLRKDDLRSRSEIFFKNYPTTDFLVLSQVIRKLSHSQEELLQTFNGRYTIDQDYDGKPEEELAFAEGQLLERHISSSHNNISVRWNRYGEPDRYQSVYEGNGQSVDILYDRYPFVREITISEYESKRTYLPPPGRLACSIARTTPLNSLDWATHTLKKVEILESEIMRNSREVLLYENRMSDDTNWILKAKYNIHDLGYLEKMQLDRDMDGVFDEISYFSGSVRLQTLRDEDRDGYFELSINYQNGPKYELDSDADGFVDYAQTATYMQMPDTFGVAASAP